MTTLKYSSFYELQRNSELPSDLRKKLHQLTCEKAFDSYLNIYKKAALSGGDPENQYILYFRCGEIGKMIMQKNAFKDGFFRKDELKNTFGKMLDAMSALEKALTKQYEENKIKNSHSSLEQKENNAGPKDVPPQARNVDESISLKKSLCIKARELVRLVENEKKTAIIIDFRLDQNTKNILYKKGSSNPILIMSLPRELIKPGLLFSALKHQLPVGQRPLLNKISACDYVVLMDSGNTEFLNDEPIPSTEAGILKLALTEYNVHDKLQSVPLFMEGGFESWVLQYPMYVNNIDHNLDLQCGDSLAAIVAGYKRATLPFDYPELSPKKVPRQIPPPVTETISTVVEPVNEISISDNCEKAVSNVTEEADPRRSTNNEYAPKELVYPTPERPPKPLDLANDSNKNAPSSPKLPRLAGGQSVVSIKPANVASISDMRISDNVASEKPIFNRADKPGELRAKPSQTHSVNNVQPRASNSIPALDRSTKPSIEMSTEQRDRLLQIYSVMAQNIADSAVAEHSAPGQTGLYNMGNTCFMSACLQALFQTPHLVKIFTRDYFTKKVNMHNRLGTKGIISAVFSALIDNVWSGYFKAFKPKRFLTLFASEVNEMLMNGEQQDASEFYMLLLGTLHEDTSEVFKAIPPVQNYSGGENIRREAADFEKMQLQFSCSPISRLMHPRTVAEVTCSTCKKKSVKFEDINIIQVGLPPPRTGHASLVDCLHNSFSATNLDGLWDCPHCKTRRAASQKLSLWKLPTVIVIHLLRFSFTGGDYVKNDIPVSFDPENLDMSPFLHPAADRHNDTAYRLYSVTNHRGRLNSGHYTAFCRHLRTGDWLRFDDEYVTRAAVSDISFSDAYILYFKKVKE